MLMILPPRSRSITDRGHRLGAQEYPLDVDGLHQVPDVLIDVDDQPPFAPDLAEPFA